MAQKEHKRLSKITRVSFRQYKTLISLLIPEVQPSLSQSGKAATPLQVILDRDLVPIAVLPHYIELVRQRPAPPLLQAVIKELCNAFSSPNRGYTHTILKHMPAKTVIL